MADDPDVLVSAIQQGVDRVAIHSRRETGLERVTFVLGGDGLAAFSRRLAQI